MAVLALAFTLTASAQNPQTDWSFPRAGMATKKIADISLFDVGSDFWAGRTDIDGIDTVIVVFPSKLDAVIDSTNRAQPGKIADRDQFIVAVCIEKAVITPTGETNEYLGPGNLQRRRFHFFKTSNGSYVAGSIADGRKYVVLFQAPDPGNVANH